MFDYLMQLIFGSGLSELLLEYGVDPDYIPLLFVVFMCVASVLVLYIFICFFQFILSIINRRK